MNPEDITIAVTVYDRRAYIQQALDSALQQTLPVRVMVVEDCGPDATLRPFIIEKYGSRVVYHRNARRRGIFDNWNACVDLCATPWLCICHDDDFLESCFVEAMVELAGKLPGKGLYHGQLNFVTGEGRLLEGAAEPAEPRRWRETTALEAAMANQFIFPSQLFRVEYVRELGGFNPHSLFAGDWDLWTKLTLRRGAAWTSRVVANSRTYEEPGRGTTKIQRSGRYYAAVHMQHKKNLALLRRDGIDKSFERKAALRALPVSTRYLLSAAAGWSPRWLKYNYSLLLRSPSPTPGHLLLKTFLRCVGPRGLKSLSNFAGNRQRGAKLGPGRG